MKFQFKACELALYGDNNSNMKLGFEVLSGRLGLKKATFKFPLAFRKVNTFSEMFVNFSWIIQFVDVRHFPGDYILHSDLC